jgi:hypothetical protein
LINGFKTAKGSDWRKLMEKPEEQKAERLTSSFLRIIEALNDNYLLSTKGLRKGNFVRICDLPEDDTDE